MKGSLLVGQLLLLVAVTALHADSRTACSRPTPRRAMTCVRVTPVELAANQDARTQVKRLVGDVVVAARAAAVDPRLLLAILIRESGDRHRFDWLSRTPISRMHRFSVGVANLQASAFAEARAHSGGAIAYGWLATMSDPVKSISAAAFLIAKRQSQLHSGRSRQLTDAEYVRIGYRSGHDAMEAAQRQGEYPPGVELFGIAYDTARRLLGQGRW